MPNRRLDSPPATEDPIAVNDAGGWSSFSEGCCRTSVLEPRCPEARRATMRSSSPSQNTLSTISALYTATAPAAHSGIDGSAATLLRRCRRRASAKFNS